MINSPPSIKHDVTCNLNIKGGGAACEAGRLESIFRHLPIVLFQTHIFPMSRRQRPASSHLQQVSAAAKKRRKTPETGSRLVSRPLSRERRLKRYLVYREISFSARQILYLIQNGCFEHWNYFRLISRYSYFPKKGPRRRLFDVRQLWIRLGKDSAIRMTDVTKSIP